MKEALLMTSISDCAAGKGRHLSYLYKLTYVPNVGNCPTATETSRSFLWRRQIKFGFQGDSCYNDKHFNR